MSSDSSSKPSSSSSSSSSADGTISEEEEEDQEDELSSQKAHKTKKVSRQPPTSLQERRRVALAAAGVAAAGGRRGKQAALPGADVLATGSAGMRRKRQRAQNEESFELNLEALQGRWQHSSVNLGAFTVSGNAVNFEKGMVFTIIERADGILEMAGWEASREKSTAHEITWMKADRTCSWHFEGDLDEQHAGVRELVDVNNIVHGKRRHAQVDYRALALELQSEQPYGRDEPVIHSDDSNFGDTGSQADRAPRKKQPRERKRDEPEALGRPLKKTRAKHLQQQPQAQVQAQLKQEKDKSDVAIVSRGKAAHLAQQQLTSREAVVPRQKRRLRAVAECDASDADSVPAMSTAETAPRAATIATASPVEATAGSVKSPTTGHSYQQGREATVENPAILNALADAATTSGAGTNVTPSNGSMPSEWAAARADVRGVMAPPRAERAGGPTTANVASLPADAARIVSTPAVEIPSATATEAAADAAAPESSKTEEAAAAGVSVMPGAGQTLAAAVSSEEAMTASAAGMPTAGASTEELSGNPCVKQVPEAPDNAVVVEAVKMPSSVHEAKVLLETEPSESMANKLLMFLKEQPMDSQLLEQTMIGATVNKLQKLYRKGGQHENAKVAAQLVDAWRQVWQSARQSVRKPQAPTA
mmetsp:Transcript_126014/g.251547  ORF Transcript_126014/g.251547 Transcript_126014/m.251547 type:complete len:649 (-) Transcript_126014:108-2054(-)